MCLRALEGHCGAFVLFRRGEGLPSGAVWPLRRRRNRRLFVVEWGGLDEAPGRPGQFGRVDATMLRRHLAPGHRAPTLGDADEQQREPAQQDVRADAILEAVEDSGRSSSVDSRSLKPRSASKRFL